MTERLKRIASIVSFERLLLVILLVVGIIAARGYFDEREDRVRMETEVRALQERIKLADQRADDADRRMEIREKETARLIDEIQQLRARPATIREIVREIPRFITLPGIPTVELVRPDSSMIQPPEPEAALKEQLVFSAEQAKALRTFYLDCAQAGVRLNACGEDLRDMREKVEALGEQVRLTERQRDVALRAVKGGGLWTRVKRNAGWFIVGGVVGGGLVVLAK